MMAKSTTVKPKEVASKTVKPASASASQKRSEEQSFAFGRENYYLMIAGVLVIFIGFFLMSGKEDIFSTTKITVAPVVVILGFLVEVFAITYKSKDKE